MERFGDYARVQREKRRISLRTVAQEIGFTPAYVSDIERGNRNPPAPHIVQKWAMAIGEDVDSFVRRSVLDRDKVEIPVNRDPEKAAFAMTFARTFDHISESKKAQILKLLEEQGE